MTALALINPRQAAAKRHPLQRIGSPQDVAHMAALLLSEAANWITGQVIPIDGGMGALRVFR
ncbi:MAG: SDR family oxidoreductase [Desulfobacterales bacterium]|jgi:NAD(P)-dependent dehydrogenase (short-subunit alcohol dehydrogenase family)|nr:SDR family oxidoreductase [Desulfobacterales bacterium]